MVLELPIFNCGRFPYRISITCVNECGDKEVIVGMEVMKILEIAEVVPVIV